MTEDIRILQGRSIRPDIKTALALGGYRQGTPFYAKAIDEAEKLVPTVARAIMPKAALAFDGERLYAIYTVGAAVDRLAKRYEDDGDYTAALLVSGLADSCLFALEKQLQPQIQALCRAEGVGIARRGTPGGTLPMEVVAKTVTTTKAGRTLHVSCNDAYVLTPAKSMCVVYELTVDDVFHMEHDCGSCSMTDCPLRKAAAPAGKGTTAVVKPGVTLQKALEVQGLAVDALCGGKGKCGKCLVRVLSGEVPASAADVALLTKQQLADGWRLACQDAATTEATIFVPQAEAMKAVAADISGDERTAIPAHDLGIAIDIGTTTLAVALVDRDEKHVIRTVTAVNSQRAYGADVVSRIEKAVGGAGAAMQQAIQGNLNGAIGRLFAGDAAAASHVSAMAIAGNTTMEHLLLGYDCHGLANWPFRPVSLGGETLHSQEVLGADCPISCDVYILPGFSAFVGADIAAGIWHCGCDDKDRPAFFLDLGTNGEMAVSMGNPPPPLGAPPLKGRQLIVASTAAGPALEGGNISCGVGSIAGAVSGFAFDALGAPHIQTIGDAAPVGLCGTGLIEVVAALVERGIIDTTGKLAEPYFSTGYTIAKRADGTDFTLTQKDIRELQMAKGAIRAGIETLLRSASCSYDDIGMVYLAGGFGYFLKPEKAASIGLLPQEWMKKTKSVGNTSLLGACDVLYDSSALGQIQGLCGTVQEEVLGNSEAFQNLYIHYMEFPTGGGNRS